MTNSSRFIFLRLIIWSETVLLISTLTLGTIYIFGLGTNNVQLASIIEYPALESSTLFLSLVLTLTVLVVLIRVLVTVRGKISKPQVDLEVKRRLLNIGDQVKSMMQIERPVKFFVGIRSYNASVRKNRVIVGERLLRDSTDQEIQGVIGHELAHIKGKDITKKAVLQGTAVLVLFVPYVVFESSNTALILAGTLLSLVLLLSVPITWKIELSADAKAAEYLGPAVVIQALEKLKTTAYTGMSFTHPPMSRRIKRLHSTYTLVGSD
jgi:Zn-dependent protease with chaperone function